jgi:hypothetical protein
MQREEGSGGGGLKVLVCYGSQTGNAEFLAKRVHALIDKELPDLRPQLQCMKDYTKVQKLTPSLPHIVACLCSAAIAALARFCRSAIKRLVHRAGSGRARDFGSKRSDGVVALCHTVCAGRV